MFVGRKKELAKLNQMYQTNQFQFAVVYGRRRIGKTALIQEFTKDKDAIYFVGLEENAHDNLVRFSTAIANYEHQELMSDFSYGSFENCFKEIGRLAKKQRIVLVIDEYPYLAQSAPVVSSMLQSYIDHEFKETNLFLILCGSSMSFMENQVLAYKSPLYGRRTAQFKLQPFSLKEAQAYFPKMDKEEVFELNTITGGIPLYLSYMSAQKDLWQNISDSFLEVNAPLFQETDSLLKQELRDPKNYNSVINAIADGASRVNDIAMKAHLATPAVTTCLNNLIDLGIVAKKVPVTEENKHSRKTIYVIADGLFRFWHTYVSKYMNAIMRGATDSVLAIIKNDFTRFMGPEFERLSQDYLWEHIADQELVPPINYEVVRTETDTVAKNLSEGERNFIAFMYFLQQVYGSDNMNGNLKGKIIILMRRLTFPKAQQAFRIETIRKYLLKVAGKVVHTARRIQLKLSATHVYQGLFKRILLNIQQL